MKIIQSLAILPAVLLLHACSDSTNYNFDTSINNQRLVAQAVDQATAEVGRTFPTNLLFADSTDGTLNLPLDEGVSPDDIGNPRVALNAQDGFSTIEPITASLDADMDAATVALGTSVRVFEVTADPATKITTGITRELTAADVLVRVIPNPELSQTRTLAIIPLTPLKESTHYMVIVTNDIKDTTGANIAEPSAFLQVISGPSVLTGDASPLEGARRQTRPLIVLATGEGITQESIVLAWSFQTQSITPVLAAVKALSASGGAMTLQDSTLDSPGGLADMFIGTLDLPYYQSASSAPDDPTAIRSNWQGQGGSNLTAFNPTPVATSTQTVPVLMTLPNAASEQSIPPDGWPIAIFVHGITGDRTNMLAIADSMARAGIAVIAIDQPLHGVTDTTSGLYAGNTLFPSDVERTFDIDLVNNTTGEQAADNVTDASGTHFYSPQFLLTARDNLRQSAADLMVLSASIDNITEISVDKASKTLVGHSLGGTVATTFLAFDDTIKAATLAMPAAGLARMLIASPRFGPPLIQGLTAANIEQGTADFEAFLSATQAVIDSGDSINHGAQAAANTAIHIIEIVGDGTAGTEDQSVPNSVATAALAGTDPLARQMGFDPTSPTSVTTAGPALVQFTAGVHRSLLDPSNNPLVTQEMQAQTVSFAKSLGTNLVINTSELIKQ